MRLNTIPILLEAFNNDYVRLFAFCEQLGGMSLNIPKVAHKTYMARKMLELNANPKEIKEITGLSTRTIRRLKAEIKK